MTPSSRSYVTPLGPLRAASTASGIRELVFEGWHNGETFQANTSRPLSPSSGDLTDAAHHLDLLAHELTAYFAGTLRAFTVPLDLAGTPFQQRVWAELLRIPYGQTISYGVLAKAVTGGTNASRAVASANGQNRVAILIPCHRVIGADGSLTGYAGGLHRKRGLLALERGQLGLF